MVVNKKFVSTIRNRVLISLAILLVIRIGTFLPVPGINHTDLTLYLEQHSTAKNFLNTFSGSKTFVIGLFTLNIFPYINATILVQLILSFSPEFSKLQKEGELQGRRLINRLTRLITLILAIAQSIGISLYLKQILLNWNYNLGFEIVVWLTTGSIIMLWLSELITEYGLGNGASLLIYTNIVANIPNLLSKTFLDNKENFNFSSSIILIGLICILFYGIIFLQRGTRKIPLIAAKQLNKFSAQDMENYFIPLRLNQAGVMPIILTTSFLVLPNYIIQLGIFPWLNFLNSFKFLYWLGYFSLILLSSSFYSSIVLKPKDLSDRLQKMAVVIPNRKPGLQTIFYLKQVIQRITVIGAVLLAFITITPNFIESTLQITSLNGLSTTSFLILVGVVLDLGREVSNVYYSNIYTKRYN